MLRVLLTVLLPVALPLVLYLFYVKMVRSRPAPGQGGAAVEEPSNTLMPWIALGLAILLMAGMLSLWLVRGVPPGTKLVAPRMENGEIVPSHRLDQAQ